MLTATIALILLQDTVQLGTVDVSGRAVAVTVPAARGPYNDSTPHVEINGWKYVVDGSSNLGARYRTDGGWGEVAEAYPAVSAKSAAAPEYRVRVFLFTNTNIVEEGQDGVWRERRGTIEPSTVEEIYSALARFKAMAEVAAEGGVRLTFDVTSDDDLLFRFSEKGTLPPSEGIARLSVGTEPASGSLLGAEFVYNEIGPRVNNDPFESEDGKYRGPYSSVFVVHGMRTRDVSTFVLDRTPVTTVSWPTFSDFGKGDALSVLLFRAWVGHLSASASARSYDVAMTPAAPWAGGAPGVFDVPLSAELLRLGNRMATPAYNDPPEESGVVLSAVSAESFDLARLPYVPLEETAKWNPRGRTVTDFGGGRYAVRGDLTSRFLRTHANAKAVSRFHDPRGGWDWAVCEAPGLSAANDVAALQVQPTSLPAAAILSPGPEQAQIGLAPMGYGDFKASVTDDPLRGPVANVEESGMDRRGYVVLATAGPGQTLFRATAQNGLKFRAQCELPDAYVLRLVGRSGLQADVQLFGQTLVPNEVRLAPLVIDASKAYGQTWADYDVPLAALDGEDIVEVRVAPPAYASCYDRTSDGSKPFRITSITVGLTTNSAANAPLPQDPDIAWLRGLTQPFDAPTVSKLKLLLGGTNPAVKLNALGAMTRLKNIELIPDLAMHTSSGSSGEAFLSVRALLNQEDDRAWSSIAFSAVRGPFGHSYKFAADALVGKKEDVTLELLSIPLISRSHHARLAAARSLSMFTGEQAGVVASATLSNGDPDPMVRFALVRRPRPDSELFARRALFAAVNDDSEWVRAAAYLSLIDSPFVDVRDEAVRGVRDESIAVRLALLEAMAAHPQEHYRAALRTSIIDASPMVRAATLRAFAVQPGDVAIAEVQNTLSDPSPMVRRALKELAKKKNLPIPPMP